MKLTAMTCSRWFISEVITWVTVVAYCTDRVWWPYCTDRVWWPYCTDRVWWPYVQSVTIDVTFIGILNPDL